VLRIVAENRLGDVILTEAGGRPMGTLSLSKIVTCLALRNKKSPLKLKSVSSKLKLASEGESFSDTLRYMMRNRIRRAVVKRERDFYGITEREIMKAFFSHRELQSLSEGDNGSPNTTLGNLADGHAKLLPKLDGDVDVHEAWRHLDGDPRSCLIVDHNRIATPWDLVIKPFLEGNLFA
ncbi:MAG: hypothetical protein ACRD6W_03200, partial [Nitrososphaerales archaeon]